MSATLEAMRRSRKDAVLRLVEAASRLRDDEALVAALVDSTGLSREGVRWALAHHLEAPPRETELQRLFLHAGEAEEVTVVLSANVFTAALRALALARAAAPRVRVRPSRREPHFVRWLVERAGDPALELAPELALGDVARGEVHVYGRDETITAVRAQVPPGVRVRGHGAGIGVAWVGAAAHGTDAVERLARDVVAFDQRGCLSPRVVLAAGSLADARAFAARLHEALQAFGARVPRGALGEDERAQLRRYEDAMTFSGDVWSGPASLVAVAAPGAPLTIPPAGRCVHIASVGDARRAAALLAPWSRFVVCFGADDASIAERLAPPHARLAKLGEMQRPPLDGPVDLRPTG